MQTGETTDPRATTRREWTEVDGRWTSDDTITIHGSDGHYWHRVGNFEGLEYGTELEAMTAADKRYRHLPPPGAYS